MTSCCPPPRMRWSGATGAIARGKNRSTGYARRCRSVHAWRWICGVKPKPKAVNKPSPHFIVHGLDKPGVFTTVSKMPPFHTDVRGRCHGVASSFLQVALIASACRRGRSRRPWKRRAAPGAGGMRRGEGWPRAGKANASRPCDARLRAADRLVGARQTVWERSISCICSQQVHDLIFPS